MKTDAGAGVVAQKTGRIMIGGRSVRWSDDLADAAYDAGLWVHDTMGAALSRLAVSHPDHVVVVDGDVRLTAQELYAEAEVLARAMLAFAKPGSVVSFLLPNWYEAAIIYSAATLAGMIVNPILPSLREYDLTFILNDAQSSMVFIPEVFRGVNYRDMLARVVEKLDHDPVVFEVRGKAGGNSYKSLLAAAGEQVLPYVHPDSVRMIMYTSGTTGMPKGVLHSHNSIHALIRQLEQHWMIEEGDSFLVPSPISHIGGSIYAFECPLLLRTTAVLMDKWDAASGIDLMNRECCTHVAAATPFLAQTLEVAKTTNASLDALKVFICGGASVSPSLIEEAAEYFKGTIFTRVYGSTEVPVTTIGVMDKNDTGHAATTDGMRGIADIRLVGAGDCGEIRVRGPQMLVGYLHAEDEASVFDDGGYYRTGDLGHWVDDRYLVIAGRAKDIIIRNGENISPKEVEDLLVKHPKITEVAIVGIPDARTGERACAVVVPSKGHIPDLQEITQYLMAYGVAKFKLPEQLMLEQALPRNDAGKILKHQIRAQLIDTFNETERAIDD